MFGDNNIRWDDKCFSNISCSDSTNYHFRFDLKLDKCGVDVKVLKDPIIPREFVGQTEDREKELKKKNCPVVETCFLTKYKNRSFLFEDNEKVCTVFEGSMKFHQKKTSGCMLREECSEESVEDEGFSPLLNAILIQKYPQAEGINEHKPPVSSLEGQQ